MKFPYFFKSTFLAALLSSPAAIGANLTWSGTSDDDWYNHINWGGVLPESSDSAIINTPGADITLDCQNKSDGSPLVISQLALVNGKLTIERTNVTMTRVGDQGLLSNGAGAYSELIIGDGAVFTYGPNGSGNNHQLLISHHATAEAVITVKDGGRFIIDISNATGKNADNTGLLQVGSVGKATLNVLEDGYVGVVHLRAGNSGDSALGIINIDGGVVDVSKKMHIGNMGGAKGYVEIKNGGILNTGGASYIGNQAETEGHVRIDNGTWKAASWISVGESSQGTLTISNGGQLITSNATAYLYVGHLEGGSGMVDILDNGTIKTSARVYIGYSKGSEGVINIQNGAFQSTSDVFVASYVPTVVLKDYSSTGTINGYSGELIAKNVNLGTRGNGQLHLYNDFTVKTDSIVMGATGSSYGGSTSAGLLEIHGDAVRILDNSGTGLAEIKTNSYGTATVRFSHDGELDFANNITGKILKVEHIGAGITVLGAGNSYQNGTDIYAGTMVATADNSFGTGTIQFFGISAITLDQDGGTTLANDIIIDDEAQATINSLDYDSTLTGVISGLGPLVKKGSGSLTLRANIYEGGTYMDEGNIVITTDSSVGTGDIYFTGNSGLVFANDDLVLANNLKINPDVVATLDSRDHDVEMSGLITGDGKLRKEGDSTITLTSDEIHNVGGLDMFKGTLVFQNKSLLGNVNIDDTATLTIRGDSTLSTLEMTGRSTLNVEADTVINSNADITGAAVVNISDAMKLTLAGGRVEVDILGQEGTVVNQGTLTARNFEGHFENRGAAIIHNTGGNVLNEGLITLGSNDLTWGGTLVNKGQINFPDISSILTVAEVAGGTSLRTDSPNGSFHMTISMLSGETSHMLVQGSSSGRFHLVMTDASEDPNKIDPLKHQPVIARVQGDSQAVFFGNFDAGLWNYDIVSIDGPNGAVDWVPSLTTEISDEGNTLINMTGAIASGWFSQLDRLHKRMGEFRLIKGSSNASMKQIAHYINCSEIWVRTFGQQVNTDLGIPGVSRFREYQFGGDMGVDRALACNDNNLFIGGVFGGYQRGERDFRDKGASKADINNFYAGLYGTWLHNDGWFADLVVKGQRYEQTYRIRNEDSDKGSYYTPAFGASIEFGRQLAMENNWFIEPTVQAAYLRIEGKGHTTYMGLHADYSNANVYQLAATVRGGKTFSVDNMYLQPYAKAGVVEQMSSGGRVTVSDLSWRPNTDGLRAVAGAGIMWQFGPKDQIHLDYEANFSDKYIIPWSVNLGYRRSF